MQRIKELDAIRGLASLSIVVYHLWFNGVGLLGAAVNLFFVLSGYLITSILLSHKPSPGFLVSFHARRSLRIWPIYYLALVVLVLLNPYTARPGSLDGLGYHATFFQNITYYWSDSAPAFIPAFRHTWSLAIEEQFYLFWPALVWLTGRGGIRWLTAGLIGLAVTTRALGFNSWILATQCDCLALGALLADVFHAPSAVGRGGRPFALLGMAAAGFWAGGAVAMALVPPAWRDAGLGLVQSLRLFSLNLAFFAIVGLVVTNAGSAWLGFLRLRPLAYLGQISYGLYLYHHIVFLLWDDYAARRGMQQHLSHDLAKTVLSFAIAAFSWRYVERPILSLKDRFSYRANGRAAGDSGQVRPSRQLQEILADAATRGDRPRPEPAGPRLNAWPG